MTGPAISFLFSSNRYQLVSRVLVDEGLLARQELVEDTFGAAKPPEFDGGAQVGLEVEELELRGLAEDADHAGGVLDAGEVDHDLIVALLANLRLRDAEPVDTVAEDLDRAVEIGFLQRAVRRRDRLQRHLEPALEVEPERGLCRRAAMRESRAARRRSARRRSAQRE